jgi:hypothetical protein
MITSTTVPDWLTPYKGLNLPPKPLLRSASGGSKSAALVKVAEKVCCKMMCAGVLLALLLSLPALSASSAATHKVTGLLLVSSDFRSCFLLSCGSGNKMVDVNYFSLDKCRNT